MNKDELIEALQEVLDNRSKMDSDLHKDHHIFIETLLEKQRRRQELWDKIRAQTWAWGIIAFLGWVGTVVYRGTIEYLKQSLHK